MSDASGPASELRGYHAHIYYDPATRPAAERLHDAVAGRFDVKSGGFRDEPVGPHPVSNVQIIFAASAFQHVVPYLMLNRDGLDILVHPLTESSYDDHSRHALWLGRPVDLKLEVLSPRYRAELLP
jgi:DOPA 4,5-dioxygenase